MHITSLNRDLSSGITLAIALASWTINLASCPCSFAQDSANDVQVNHAATSELKRGSGLASMFPADQGISDHKSVIFCDDFEKGELETRWDERNNADNQALSFADESKAESFLGKRSLQVTARLTENSGGGLTKWFKPSEQVFIRFYTKFDKKCDYVHHFCTLRANKSLEGSERWSGFGGAGLKPEGDGRFSTAIEPWGNWGKYPPPGRWNFYSYWHSMKPSPDGMYWGNSFEPKDQSPIAKDQWICVEFMLKHNTPGQSDGEQAYWIDGELVGHWREIPWRTSATLYANAFTLESYVTDRWTKQNENIVFFDNVVIAKEYIGPSVAK